MSIRSFRNLLLGSTALTLVAFAVPTLAQTSGNDQSRSNQTSSSMAQDLQMNADRNSENWNQRGNQANNMPSFSDDQNFSKITVAAANDIVGKSLGSNDGAYAGDVEYMLIEPVSGKVMYLLVGMGNWYTVDQRLAVVPYEAVNVVRNAGDGDNMKLTLRAGFNTLRNAPTLTDSELTNLTSPRMQRYVRNFWSPVAANGNDQQMNNQQSGNQQSRNQQSGNQQSGNRQSRNQQSGNQQWDSDRAGNRQARNQDSGNQDLGNRQFDNRQASNQSSDGEQQSGNRQSRNQQSGNQQSGNQQVDSNQVYTLVARTYITALAPPAVMRPDQLRGATVSNRDGDEVGTIDKLIVDLKRGYVAYALISEGGFLGIGENWRPVPVQALTWQEGELFMLPVSSEQLKSMPSLKDNELPGNVRRKDVESLFNSYSTEPYWQQASVNGMRNNSSSEGMSSNRGNQNSMSNRTGRGNRSMDDGGNDSGQSASRSDSN